MNNLMRLGITADQEKILNAYGYQSIERIAMFTEQELCRVARILGITVQSIEDAGWVKKAQKLVADELQKK